MAETEAIEGFIALWQGVTGRERANYQLFLTELTGVLDLPAPEPAVADEGANSYCFERQPAAVGAARPRALVGDERGAKPPP